MKENRVVITGIGPICSLGIGKKKVWTNVINAKTRPVEMGAEIFGKKIPKYFQHKITDLDSIQRMCDKEKMDEIRTWTRSSTVEDLELIIASIKLALTDSQVKSKNGVGLILAHENPGLEKLLSDSFVSSFKLLAKNKLTLEQYSSEMYDLLERSAYETQSFMFLHHVAKYFKIHGYSLLINNACSSGLYGLEAAAQLIKGGANNVMIVAAVDNPKIFKYMWAKKMGVYSRSHKTKPFTKERDGFIFGEGSGAIVLEDYQFAKKRKAKIYGEYLGGGFALESWKVSYPSIQKNYLKLSMRQALKNARLTAKDIDLINAHGVGNYIGDLYEARAIKDIFRNKTPPITAFKSLIGHNLGASALIELILLLMVMDKKKLPPILHNKNEDARLGIKIAGVGSRLKYPLTALKTSTSFGGYTGAVIIKK